MGIISADAARKLLAPIAADLRQCINVAVANYLAHVAPLFSHPEGRMRASVIQNLLTDEIRRRFQDRGGVRVFRTAEGRTLMRLGRTVLLQFKQLDEALMPQNYPTPTAQAFDQQLELPEIGSATRVTIGFRLNRLGTAASRAAAVCTDGRAAPAWMIDLDEVAASQPSGGVVVQLDFGRPMKKPRRLRPVRDLRPKKPSGDDDGPDSPKQA